MINKSNFHAKLNTNYKGFRHIQGLLDEIYEELSNIDLDVIDELKNEIENIKKTIGLIFNNIGDITSSITTIRNNINTINSEISTLNQNVTNINTDLSSLTERVNQIQSLLTVARDDISKLKTDVSKNASDIVTINSDITSINHSITNINTEITTIKSNITNLQNDLDNENNNRIAGDNAINNRLNSIQFLKWLKREDFGESIEDDSMFLGTEDWIKHYDFEDTKYLYTNTFILSSVILLSQYVQSCNLEDYGITLDIIPKSSENRSAVLEVRYNHNKNVMGNNNGSSVAIYLLYTQYRTDVEPDIMPY